MPAPRKEAAMSLKDRILDDVKSAMKAKEKERLGVLRQVTAAIKQIEVDTREELPEAGVLALLEKMIKQRKESIAQFAEAQRQDLVDKEQHEIEVISAYMPEPLSDAELAAMVDAAIAEVGATSMKEMGKVMGILKPQVAGRCDFGALSGTVKARLS